MKTTDIFESLANHDPAKMLSNVDATIKYGRRLDDALHPYSFDEKGRDISQPPEIETLKQIVAEIGFIPDRYKKEVEALLDETE